MRQWIYVGSLVLSIFTASNAVAKDVLVYLRDQADLSRATRIEDRTERIQFVYDTLRKHAKRTQPELVSFLKSRHLSHQSFYIVNAIAVSGATDEDVALLNAHPQVKAIHSNALVSLKLPAQPDPLQFELPSLRSEPAANVVAVGADRVWRELNVRGAGIVVGGQDTGYAFTHPALRAQYRGYSTAQIQHDYSWHDAIRGPFMGPMTPSCGYDAAEPCDDSGHGTHTMGSILGYDGADNVIGVAPEAKWIGCRNMNNGDGRASTYLECFEFFLAPYPRGGDAKTDGRPDLAPHVINNSWGCPASEGCAGDEFVGAVRALHAAGILVVASAGNEGSSCGSVADAPGHYSGELMSVAAYDHRTGEIAYFSSRGPARWNGGLGPNISAPGVGVRSSVPSGGIGEGGLYEYMSGTSMAGPHVVGVVALLWSARPELIGKIPETMALLEQSATPKTSTQNCGNYPGNAVPNAVYGYGLVNAYNAIQKAEALRHIAGDERQ